MLYQRAMLAAPLASLDDYLATHTIKQTSCDALHPTHKKHSLHGKPKSMMVGQEGAAKASYIEEYLSNAGSSRHFKEGSQEWKWSVPATQTTLLHGRPSSLIAGVHDAEQTVKTTSQEVLSMYH
jgi:hypothetical protein